MNTRSFDRSLGNMRKSGAKAARSVSDSFRRAGQRMKSIGMGMSAALTAPLAGAGLLALKTAADYESLRMSMDILNKSVEEGARNFKRLKEFSARTPFQLKDLAEAQNMLQGFGQSADDAFKSVKMIGDIAAVASGNIKGIGIAFGQAAAEGRLMTRDIRQLINQGVPAIKLLSNTMGVAKSEIFDMASQGKISFEILQQAFRDATSQGGMFANGMKKQAQTLSGVWSTLKDNFSLALGEIGQSMADAFDIKDIAKKLIAGLQRFTEWFSNLSDSAKRMAFTIAGALGAGGPILVALGTLTAALGAISWPVVLGVSAMAATTTTIIKNWDEVAKYFTSGGGAQMWDDFKGIIKEFKTTAINIWNEFGDDIISITKTTFGVTLKIVEKTLSSVLEIMKKFNGNFDDELNVFEDNWLTTLSKIDSKIVGFTMSAAKRLGQTFNLIDTEYDKIVREFEKRDLEFDFGLVFTDKERREALNFLNKIKTMEARASVELKQSESVILDAKLPSIDELTKGVDMDLGRKLYAGDIESAGFSNITSSLDQVAKKSITTANQYNSNLKDMEVAGSQFSSATEAALSNLPSKFEEFVKMSKKAGFDFVSFMSGRVASAISGFAENIGKMFAGTGNEFATGLEKILLLVTDFAKKLGNLLIGIGTAIAFVPFMQGNAAAFIAGGAALTALATGVSSGIKKRMQNRRDREQNGGTFHTGGMVPGTGERMIRAKGGEMVLTQSQQRALGGMMGGGGTTVSPRAIGAEIGKQLDKRLQKLSNGEIYAMAQKGRRGF